MMTQIPDKEALREALNDLLDKYYGRNRAGGVHSKSIDAICDGLRVLEKLIDRIGPDRLRGLLYGADIVTEKPRRTAGMTNLMTKPPESIAFMKGFYEGNKAAWEKRIIAMPY